MSSGELPRFQMPWRCSRPVEQAPTLLDAREKGFTLIRKYRNPNHQSANDFIHIPVTSGSLVLRAPQDDGSGSKGPLEVTFKGSVDGKNQEVKRLALFDTYAEQEGTFTSNMRRVSVGSEHMGIRVLNDAYDSLLQTSS